MKLSGKCPKCEHKDIRGPHRIFGQNHVRVDLPGMATATFDSYTCTRCGYTELYTDRIGLNNLKRDGRKYRTQPQSTISSKKSEREVKICSNCGSFLTKEDRFCPNCGTEYN